MRELYSVRTFEMFALGHSERENHHKVSTVSLVLSFRLFTHSIGLGSFDELCQKNSWAK